MVWLREGDKNTRFFHQMANAHRQRNQMCKVRINGVWLTEEQDIRLGMGNAFKCLLTKSRDWQPSSEGIRFANIVSKVAASLEQSFLEVEILKALSDFNGDKAPGPDGFP